jgi:membrane protein YdbS with pleckstrin-like domain
MENHKKHSLGGRAFLLFFFRRLKGPIILFIFAWAAWYGEQWLPAGSVASPWVSYAAQVLLLAATLYLLVMLLVAYLIYRAHTYMFTEEAFMMASGVTTRNEIAALYHQIQNVNVNRSPTDRLLGVSQIVIFMTGSEREAGHTKIVLPALGKAKAKLVQGELLTRARRHVPPAAPREE